MEQNMPANYSLNFDFGTCSVSPLGRGKKPSRLQQMLGDDPFENSLVEQMSLINKAIFQAPAPSYSKRCVTARFFPPGKEGKKSFPIDFFSSRNRDVRFFVRRGGDARPLRRALARL